MSITLKAEKREILGSSSAKKLRKSGNIPVIIYSKNGNINLAISSHDFEHEYFKGGILTTIIELEYAGKKTKVIAHKIELDPVTDRPVHIDFLNCEETKIIRAKPKLVFTNQDKSPGIKKGGFLHVVLRKVEVVCDSEKAIPEKVEVDIGALHLGSKIRTKDLNFPAGVQLVRKDNFLIGSIIGRGKSEEEKAAEAAAAAPATAAGATPDAAATTTTSAAKTEEKK
ncbi:MAG: hypothetical protein A2887_00605 [Alphaproteobacteria bacterium RIFCSPLOWO2_01_FULL_40_26]|nr:MAG: hypothetical protein A3D15_00975 [Alphaproteobacteria bacterium RIFCSPHIGHO2_02_FULL_40_34]OFW94689.1 MAG: hypothetical protein A2887_00605 [Alphaproteobacteria bacterium RIFCSPLOWO2_01_FULL_40_26]OFX10157.1 MAG: hypothetical protein A3H30_05065 [Alphaproteobacteria bacterium RIFCSPLOWO2_02_FULL_40_19]OFX11786.1 MAG: hypothetical protein A3G22_04655 [Alphaproteobacteria bacterium RIFCSPLOWO2_12_FULL_40_11]